MTAIRPATPADAERLAEMRYEFRATQNSPVESKDEFVARCEPWMRTRLEHHSAWRCWVGERSGEIVGNLWMQLIEKIPNPAPELECHAYITNVYVAPEDRGAGIARQLLDAALGYCQEHRVDSVILWPTQLSRPLYARHGFAEPRDILELILDENRDLH